MAPETEPTAADLAAVRQIRAALRELAAARVEGRTPHPSAFDTVNAALARAAKAPRHIVVPDPIEPGYVRGGSPDVDAALTLIIEQAIDTMSSTDAAYLRECEEADLPRALSRFDRPPALVLDTRVRDPGASACLPGPAARGCY